MKGKHGKYEFYDLVSGRGKTGMAPLVVLQDTDEYGMDYWSAAFAIADRDALTGRPCLISYLKDLGHNRYISREEALDALLHTYALTFRHADMYLKKVTSTMLCEGIERVKGINPDKDSEAVRRERAAFLASLPRLKKYCSTIGQKFMVMELLRKVMMERCYVYSSPSCQMIVPIPTDRKGLECLLAYSKREKDVKGRLMILSTIHHTTMLSVTDLGTVHGETEIDVICALIDRYAESDCSEGPVHIEHDAVLQAMRFAVTGFSRQNLQGRMKAVRNSLYRVIWKIVTVSFLQHTSDKREFLKRLGYIRHELSSSLKRLHGRYENHNLRSFERRMDRMYEKMKYDEAVRFYMESEAISANGTR